ncbi:MAG: SIMPL domain-containing protein [Bryobacteraceae bacterium]
MKQLICRVTGIAALLLTAGPSAAQTALDKTVPPFIRTSGQATLAAKPDTGKLDIGVITQGSDAQAAAAQNARETAMMIAALKKSLAAAAVDIHTSGYSLSPNFNYPKNGGQPVLNGYTASNTVEVTTNDLGNIGKVIDAGTSAGANNVRGISFSLKDEEPVRAEALKNAIRQARASAEAMAAALGLKVVRVLSAEEGAPQVIRPMQAMAMARAPGQPTPIEAGDIQIEATVTLTVEVGQ